MRELLPSSCRQMIVLPLSARLSGAPFALDISLPLETVEHRVEHSIGPLQVTGGKLAHALEDGVAVGVALSQNGENQWGGAGGDQIFADVHGLVGRRVATIRRCTIH